MLFEIQDVHALYLPTRQKSHDGFEQGTPASIATLSPAVARSRINTYIYIKDMKVIPGFHWVTPGPTSTTSPADS